MTMFGRKLIPVDEEGKQTNHESNVEVGDLVKDKITGYAGVVVCVLHYLHGCNRVCVQSKELKDGLPKESQYYDEHQIEILEKGHYYKVPEPVPVRTTGGDTYIKDDTQTAKVYNKMGL